MIYDLKEFNYRTITLLIADIREKINKCETAKETYVYTKSINKLLKTAERLERSRNL